MLHYSTYVAPSKPAVSDDLPPGERYLRAFAAAAENTATALDLYNAVLDEYPDRLNRGVLWNSAQAVKA